MSPQTDSTEADAEISALVALGWQASSARGWVARLRGGATAAAVVRPATVGDGIHTLDAAQRASLASLGREVAATTGAFVPASGAATRMCEALVRARRGEAMGAEDAAWIQRLRDGWATLPFAPALAALGVGHGRDPIAAIVDEDGLGLPRRPKALVPFHDATDASPLAVHVRDARLLGLAGLHVTASEEHVSAFEAEMAASVARGGPISVAVSTQDPATHLPVLGEDGRLVRGADGAPSLRPGGHGALLANLAHAVEVGGWSHAMVRNVDNTAPVEAARGHAAWRWALLGLVVHLERLADAALSDPAPRAELAAWMGLDPARVLERLDRPFRVAGMVPSQGQPGGGPFWVDGVDGASLQIVELVQIAPGAQRSPATHFNPVEIALGTGRMGDPGRWVDPDAAIVQRRRVDGAWVTMAEHPGLWNGSMSGWNTVFVEVPADMFRPVKTVADLRGRRDASLG